MLDINFIRENKEKVKKGCKSKQCNPALVSRILEIDKKRRELIQKYEKIQAEKNKANKKIVRAEKKEKKRIIKEMQKVDKKGDKLKKKLQKTEEKFNKLMLELPNIPFDDVPQGKDESDNVEVKKVGEIPKFDFEPKGHLKIGENLNLIDTERAAKISGARFGYLKNEAVLLEFALINFAFETLLKEGFTPIIPPVMIKPEIGEGMGYPEQFDGKEAYYMKEDNLYLVGTSEQSIGPQYKEEILEEKSLPKRYLGFSTCFRREAGSYGKDTKGILRVHQFDKVEMFSYAKPQDSKREHKFLLSLEEKLMKSLKIPYRIIQMCTGDLANPSAATYDIESWMPSQDRYRETHSTSNCTNFQARRLNIRYRREKDNKLDFIHTLNGTAFAIGRTLIAILENYQKKDGTIEIPEVLQKYVSFKQISPKN